MAGHQQDWRTTMRNHYIKDGVWHLSNEMDAFLLSHTDPNALRREYARKGLGSAYSNEHWKRSDYRQWYLANYSSKYLCHVQRALLDVWPDVQFDAGMRILDVGVGPATTALAMMDLCNTAEQLGLLTGVRPPRFVAVDCDEDKLDYAYETAFAFAESCERNCGGATAWARGFVAGSDWQVLDVGDHCCCAAWPEERRCDLVVVSNTYSELCRQGAAAQIFGEDFIPRVIAGRSKIILLEPLPPGGAPEYRQNLCRAVRQLSQSVHAVAVSPCGGSVLNGGDCAGGHLCEDHFPWRLPTVIRGLFRSDHWVIDSLRATVEVGPVGVSAGEGS